MSTISAPTLPQDRPLASPIQQTAEYLCEYIDAVLGAFQVGAGILEGVDSPITHDIARRLIWKEVRYALERLEARPDGDEWEIGSQTLRIRVAGKDAGSILAAIRAAAEGCGCSRTTRCSARCIGARKEGDPTVVYATIAPVSTLDAAAVFLAELTKAELGCTVRDWAYGTLVI
jgi:hypothetical protein